MLCIIFNNEIQIDLESEVLLFADVTCLFASDIDPALTAQVLNRDLEKISAWAKNLEGFFYAGRIKIPGKFTTTLTR